MGGRVHTDMQGRGGNAYLQRGGMGERCKSRAEPPAALQLSHFSCRINYITKIAYNCIKRQSALQTFVQQYHLKWNDYDSIGNSTSCQYSYPWDKREE